ncbi:hypothetical protein MDAP_002340 [Mitosporidium daphniae]
MQTLEAYLLRYHHEPIDSCFNFSISQLINLAKHSGPSESTSNSLAKARLVQHAKFDISISINLFCFAKWFPKFANMIFASKAGFDSVKVALKDSILRILDRKIELFDFKPFLNSPTVNPNADANLDSHEFDDWDELDTNIFNLMSSQHREEPRFNEIVSWLSMEQVIFNCMLCTFSMRQLFGDFKVQGKMPMPLNGSLSPCVSVARSLSEFQGVILSISSPQGQLLHQGFQCHNSKCKSSLLSNFCPSCSGQLTELIPARIISAFNVVMLLVEKTPGVFALAKLIFSTELVKSESLLVGNWMCLFGYSDGIFKNTPALQACDEAFLFGAKEANYPFLKAEIEIHPVASCYRLPYFYSLHDFCNSKVAPQNPSFQHAILRWTGSFSFGLCTTFFPQHFRLALIISVVSALTSSIGKPLHLLIFHQEDHFIKHIIMRLRKYLWNVPWSSTEASNAGIVQSMQKYIDAGSGKTSHVAEVPLAMQLSRNSIFWIHSPLFKSKRLPFEFDHLVSPQCCCSVLAHTDVARQSLDTKTDSSYVNALSSFDMIIEYVNPSSTRAVNDALFDLYHQSYDVSEFFSLLMPISSLLSRIHQVSFDWAEEAKELVQNYFLAIRSSYSRDSHMKKENFSFVFPEFSTSQVEVTGTSMVVPKQYHLGFETPTTVVERIVRLAIILSLLSVPFRGPGKPIQIGNEEVLLSIWYIDQSICLKIGSSIVPSIPFPLLDFEGSISMMRNSISEHIAKHR